MLTTKSIHDQRGASSVLVIIMMVVLLVFGLAVLTTSLSNVRLGERKRAWLAEYYLLEGTVASSIASIDRLLIDADVVAHTYMSTEDYLEDYMIDGAMTESMTQRVFALAYHDYVMENLSTAITGYGETAYYHSTPDIEAVMNGALIEPSRLEFNISLPNSQYDKHIQVTLAILGANPDNLDGDMHLTERYQITRHTQQQEPFDYEENMDFGDPFEEGGGDNPFTE